MRMMEMMMMMSRRETRKPAIDIRPRNLQSPRCRIVASTDATRNLTDVHCKLSGREFYAPYHVFFDLSDIARRAGAAVSHVRLVLGPASSSRVRIPS